MVQYNKNLSNRAKELRREMTKHECHLWYDFLKDYATKFYKQKIIDNYIVDFYCHKAKLIIEIDGSQHYTDEGLAYDNERTKILSSCGIEVMRFSNRDIEENFDGVCKLIDNYIINKLK